MKPDKMTSLDLKRIADIYKKIDPRQIQIPDSFSFVVNRSPFQFCMAFLEAVDAGKDITRYVPHFILAMVELKNENESLFNEFETMIIEQKKAG